MGIIVGVVVVVVVYNDNDLEIGRRIRFGCCNLQCEIVAVMDIEH